MTQYLHDYFSGHAERAIAGMKNALVAQGFYSRLEPRLQNGEDLSGELSIIAQVGLAGALEVVKEAIEENKALVTSVWDLPKRLQGLGTQKVEITKDPMEHLPRVTMSYEYKCPAGSVLVTTQTAGENFKINFSSEKNKMAAEMTLHELEKEVSLALLTA